MLKRPYNFKLDEQNAHDIEMMNRITRRRFIGAGGVAIGAALAGCAAPPARETTPTATPATRTVVDLAGRSVMVPSDPQRVVAIDNNRLIVHLVELGVPVVGATSNSSNPDGGLAPTLGDKAAQIALVGEEANLEKITVLRPDLIIFNKSYDVKLELLEAIAPVVVFDGGALPRFGLFEPLQWLGRMVGRQAQAQELEAASRNTIADEGSAAGLKGKRVTLINMLNYDAGDTLAIYSPSSMSGEFGQLLGATIVPVEIDGKTADIATSVSVEVLPSLLASTDVLIAGVYGGSEDNAKRSADRKESAVWRSISAVQRGDVVYTDVQNFTHNYGLAGLKQTLDDIAEQLRK
jgi:iron complex transport system substrate-binding protein